MNKKTYMAPAITTREISNKVTILAGSNENSFSNSRKIRVSNQSMFEDDEYGYAD